MPAAGFFPVDCAVTLQRSYRLFVTEAGSRCVPVPGVTANPGGPRTAQQIRNRLTGLVIALRTSGTRPATGPGSSPRPSAHSRPVPASRR